MKNTHSRRSTILIFSFLIVSILPIISSCGQTTEQGEYFATLQQSISDLVNQYRRSRGLPPLQMVPLITAEATRHSQNMADGRVTFGHDGFRERTNRIMGQIKFSMGAAENVAFGKLTAQDLVNGWLRSPGHRKNIEGKYNLTGVGVWRAPDGYLYYTQIFIYRANR